jgi:PAS domain S-box-containing protein
MIDEKAVREHFPQLATAVSIAIAAVKYGPVAWRALKHMVRFLRSLDAIAGLPVQVSQLMQEVRPNGGASLRDAIDNTARCVNVLSDSVEALALRHQTRWTMAYGMPSWESDQNGRCIRANLELCELLGASEDEITGTNWKNCIHPDDAHRVFSEWGRIVAEAADCNLTCRYVSSSGEVIPVRLKAHVMTRGDKAIGWIGTAERTT